MVGSLVEKWAESERVCSLAWGVLSDSEALPTRVADDLAEQERERDRAELSVLVGPSCWAREKLMAFVWGSYQLRATLSAAK